MGKRGPSFSPTTSVLRPLLLELRLKARVVDYSFRSSEVARGVSVRILVELPRFDDISTGSSCYE